MVETDLFAFWKKQYLATVDYSSNMGVGVGEGDKISSLPDTRSSSAIGKLKTHFETYGILDTVFTNNGPRFALEEFKKFALKWEFDHQTSSLAPPQVMVR